ncbi:MAG TPA: replication initiator, partial [Pseudonocardiaceae bacterium]|nr:replication initiator [Pseudonocardiaceae bacterium]
MSPAATLPPRTVEEMVNRAARPDFDRWAEQVARCGHCAHPVRLRGRVEHRSATGERVAYSTDTEPDRVLLIRCGNRRAAVCPSCSYEYAGDMWQLLYAGAAGGRKGVPESIQSHPLVFATLTAPGFGPVHTTRADRTGRPARCRPTHGTPRLCPHGRPTWCTAIHAEDDSRLGQPLCPDCYDYPAHVAFNWHAPELWRRFAITLRRTLARTAGLTAAEFARRARVSFVKVAEFQRRGVVHFHALIRLDGPGEDYQPPQLGIGAAELARAIRQATAHVRLTVAIPGGADLVLRFGTQLDTQTVNGGPAGELTPEHAARYIAKYATKSAEDFG